MPNIVLWRMKGGACWTVPLCSAWKTGAAYDFRYRAPAILNDLFMQQSEVPHNDCWHLTQHNERRNGSLFVSDQDFQCEGRSRARQDAHAFSYRWKKMCVWFF